MTRFALSLLLLAALVAGCETGVRTATESSLDEVDAPDEQDVPALTAAQTQLFLRDATLARREGQREIYLYHGEDDILVGRADTQSGGQLRARGRWSVDAEGRLCHEWPADWTETATTCFEVFRYGSSYVLTASGEEARRYLRAAGDVETLL